MGALERETAEDKEKSGDDRWEIAVDKDCCVCVGREGVDEEDDDMNLRDRKVRRYQQQAVCRGIYRKVMRHLYNARLHGTKSDGCDWHRNLAAMILEGGLRVFPAVIGLEGERVCRKSTDWPRDHNGLEG